MEYLTKSFTPQNMMHKIHNPWSKEKVIDYILKETKYFIAIESKNLLAETKKKYTDKGEKFLMTAVNEIELLKVYSDDILHFLLNKGSDPIKITISLSDFRKTGLYTDLKSAALDIKIIIDEYDKRRSQYQHNLNQTNKGIKQLLTASKSMIEEHPDKFI